MIAVRRLGSPALFLLVAASVHVAAFYVRNILATVESPYLLAGAMVLDMVILVPLAYYFLVVRRFDWPTVSVAGIFVLSLIAATQIIPSEYQRVLKPLEILAVIAELLIVSFILGKAVGGIRRFKEARSQDYHEDTFHAIRRAARQVIDSDRVADILAYEVAMFYYALGSWRHSFVEGAGRFTSYKRNNYGSTLFGIGVLLVAELIAVHLLVQHYWSTTGAWILSILTAYGGILLLGDWQAQRLRPTLIADDALVLRAGMRWEVRVPFQRIRSVRRISALENKPRGALNLVAFGDALFEVTTDISVEARGAYGMRKSVDCIWFTIDNAEDFHQRLSERLPGE